MSALNVLASKFIGSELAETFSANRSGKNEIIVAILNGRMDLSGLKKKKTISPKSGIQSRSGRCFDSYFHRRLAVRTFSDMGEGFIDSQKQTAKGRAINNTRRNPLTPNSWPSRIENINIIIMGTANDSDCAKGACGN